ncbi:MAG: class I SAM-dependent methyltransferase [Acetobacteraceae bacterium]
MADDADLTLTERLLSLWNHLGLETAHVASQMPGDLVDFARHHGARLAGVVLCVPVRLDPSGFSAVARRLLLVSGSEGLTEQVTRSAQARLPDAKRMVLRNYPAPGWADLMADRTEEITEAIRDFLAQHPASPARLAPGTGSHAGILYRIEGSGPPLVLTPFFLAASQWDPAIAVLARDFTVIVLSGRHIGGVAALEDRARAPTYRTLVRTMMEIIAPESGSRILDVGCGSGALDRMLATSTAAGCHLTATDLNPYLLREAAALAREEGLNDAIRFEPANAEALPFPDASFDHAFSVTVLEECDADRALRELHRVVRPGGRVGVIVRAIDLPQWWHLHLPETLRRKVDVPPQSVGARGIADASLYRRMQGAGFRNLTCFPGLVTFDRPGGPIWRYREDHVMTQLTREEIAIWQSATAAAARDGLLFMANPLHAAVGVRLD